MKNFDAKTVALNGGILLTVLFEAVGTAEPVSSQVKVRQIPVREYETGFPFVDDEPALVGFLCGQPKEWALTLSPSAFEEILETGREVNAAGFFSSCQRRMERIQKAQAAMYGALANLPQETVKLMMERGQAMLSQSPSPTLSPGFVRPPVR